MAKLFEMEMNGDKRLLQIYIHTYKLKSTVLNYPDRAAVNTVHALSAGTFAVAEQELNLESIVFPSEEVEMEMEKEERAPLTNQP